MEAAASVALAGRGVSVPMPSSQSQSSRKEWRVVSDHLSQNSGSEDLDRSKLGQGDERLIYEGRESVNGDFFSITVDGVSDHELHLDDVVKQREQLQHLEVNLKARLIARSEVIGIQERFDSQIKDHITSNVKLQEQLHEREKTIMDLQRTLDDKDKELHAFRLDHEAVIASTSAAGSRRKKPRHPPPQPRYAQPSQQAEMEAEIDLEDPGGLNVDMQQPPPLHSHILLQFEHLARVCSTDSDSRARASLPPHD